MGYTKVVSIIASAFVVTGVTFAASSCGSDDTTEATTNVADGGQEATSSEAGPIVRGDGSVPPPTTGPISPDVAARAAVVLSSCIAEFEAESVLDQMYSRIQKDSNDYRGIATCIDSRRNGCAAIAECTGVHADLTGPCERRCDGTVAEGCDDEFKARIECPYFGRVCTVGPTGQVGCTLPGAPTCVPGSPGRCGADGRPITCRDEHEDRGPDCAARGLTCNDGQCEGTEGACQAVSGSGVQIIYEAKSCNGPMLSACVGGGMATLDCGTLIVSATCQTRALDGGTQSYCGLGSECKPGDPAQATCDGDSVVVCNGGRIDRVDCKALGFTGCVSSKTYAFCAPSLKASALAMQDGG